MTPQPTSSEQDYEIARLQAENLRLERELELYRYQNRIVAGGITLLFFGPRLVASLRAWLREASLERPLPIDETADLAAAIVRRIVSVGLIGLIFASIPSILLWKQNRLFRELTQQANELAGKQNLLLETETRETQLQRKLSRMDLLARQEEAVNDFINRLRGLPRLSNEVSAEAPSILPPRAVDECVPILRESLPELRNLARALNPIEGEISPARGRLLADLVAVPVCELQPWGTEYWVSGVGIRSWAEEAGNPIHPMQFLKYLDFSRADFSELDLSFASLSFLRAPGSRFDSASLIGARLVGADLRQSTFTGAHLGEANLQGTMLHGADLRASIALPGPPFMGMNIPSFDETTLLPDKTGNASANDQPAVK